MTDDDGLSVAGGRRLVRQRRPRDVTQLWRIAHDPQTSICPRRVEHPRVDR